MSGVEDGRHIQLNDADHGQRTAAYWRISIGRRDENDLTLPNDSFISRQHAFLHWRNGQWLLEDDKSTNGTFIENPADFFDDQRVTGTIPIAEGQLFRVGRTWLRIEPSSELVAHDNHSPA